MPLYIPINYEALELASLIGGPLSLLAAIILAIHLIRGSKQKKKE
jgi:hypothetical protein